MTIIDEASSWMENFGDDPYACPKMWFDLSSELPLVVYARLDKGKPKVDFVFADMYEDGSETVFSFEVPN